MRPLGARWKRFRTVQPQDRLGDFLYDLLLRGTALLHPWLESEVQMNELVHNRILHVGAKSALRVVSGRIHRTQPRGSGLLPVQVADRVTMQCRFWDNRNAKVPVQESKALLPDAKFFTCKN